MIDIGKYDIPALRKQFLNASPFNYIVIDNFLDELLVKEIELEIRNIPHGEWFDKETDFANINNQKNCDTQSNKIALNIRNQIPNKLTMLLIYFLHPI